MLANSICVVAVLIVFNGIKILTEAEIMEFVLFLFFTLFFINNICACMRTHFTVEDVEEETVSIIRKYFINYVYRYLNYSGIWVGTQLWLAALKSGYICWYLFALTWTIIAYIVIAGIPVTLVCIIHTMYFPHGSHAKRCAEIWRAIDDCWESMALAVILIFGAWLILAIFHGWVFFPKLIIPEIAAILLKIYQVCNRLYKWLRGKGQ